MRLNRAFSPARDEETLSLRPDQHVNYGYTLISLLELRKSQNVDLIPLKYYW